VTTRKPDRQTDGDMLGKLVERVVPVEEREDRQVTNPARRVQRMSEPAGIMIRPCGFSQ